MLMVDKQCRNRSRGRPSLSLGKRRDRRLKVRRYRRLIRCLSAMCLVSPNPLFAVSLPRSAKLTSRLVAEGGVNSPQEPVDGPASRLGRPVGVDDPCIRVLAYSAHVKDGDKVRRDSILLRIERLTGYDMRHSGDRLELHIGLHL
jgi:hypothetical protein